MRRAALAGFSYPVKVHCYITFDQLIEAGRLVWIADAVPIPGRLEGRNAGSINFEPLREAPVVDAVRAWLHGQFSAASDQTLLLVTDRLLDRVAKLGIRGNMRREPIGQDYRHAQVTRLLRKFFGQSCVSPKITNETLHRVLPRRKVLCFGADNRSYGFDTTLDHAGLSGRGVAFRVIKTNFSDRGGYSGLIASLAGEYDCLLYASSGLGSLTPRIADAFASRIHAGSRVLDTVTSLTRSLRRSQEIEERESAGLVQRELQPKRPEIPGFDVSVHWQPHAPVSGDMYDLVQITGNHIRLNCARCSR